MKVINDIKTLATITKENLKYIEKDFQSYNIQDTVTLKMIDTALKNISVIYDKCAELLVPPSVPEYIESESVEDITKELGLTDMPIYVTQRYTDGSKVVLNKIYPLAFSVQKDTHRIQVISFSGNKDIGIYAVLLKQVNPFGWIDEDRMPLNVPKGVRFNNTDTKEEICYVLNTFKKNKEWSNWMPFPIQ